MIEICDVFEFFEFVLSGNRYIAPLAPLGEAAYLWVKDIEIQNSSISIFGGCSSDIEIQNSGIRLGTTSTSFFSCRMKKAQASRELEQESVSTEALPRQKCTVLQLLFQQRDAPYLPLARPYASP